MFSHLNSEQAQRFNFVTHLRVIVSKPLKSAFLVSPLVQDFLIFENQQKMSKGTKMSEPHSLATTTRPYTPLYYRFVCIIGGK